MSNLHDFLGQSPEPPVEDQGDKIEIGYMCECGSSNTETYSKDKYKTSTVTCLDCKKTYLLRIPQWLREALT